LSEIFLLEQDLLAETRLPFSWRHTTHTCVFNYASVALALIPWPWCSILT